MAQIPVLEVKDAQMLGIQGNTVSLRAMEPTLEGAPLALDALDRLRARFAGLLVCIETPALPEGAPAHRMTAAASETPPEIRAVGILREDGCVLEPNDVVLLRYCADRIARIRQRCDELMSRLTPRDVAPAKSVAGIEVYGKGGMLVGSLLELEKGMISLFLQVRGVVFESIVGGRRKPVDHRSVVTTFDERIRSMERNLDRFADALCEGR